MNRRTISGNLILSLLTIAALLLCSGCPAPEAARPNILLISIDTLRADHLSAYGYERQNPVIDALAADSIVYERALVPIPKTTPSLFSLHTGLSPISHGVIYLGMTLSEEVLTLAEMLKENGYGTMGAVAQYLCHRKFGFGRGFDTFDDNFSSHELRPQIAGKFYPSFEHRADYIVDSALTWLGQRQAVNEPFFIWLHFFDPHGAYDPPEEYAERYSGSSSQTGKTRYPGDVPPFLIHPQVRFADNVAFDHYNNLYDGEIAYLDSQLGRLLGYLKEEGLYENTLIVLTADHGEYMGENDNQVALFSHGYTATDPEARVPLIMKLPDEERAGERVVYQVSTVDIAATITTMLGIEASHMQGTNLLDVSEATEQIVLQPEGGEFAWSDGSFKLVAEMPRVENVAGLLKVLRGMRDWPIALYDLRIDPLERQNIAADHPEKVESILQKMVRAVLDTHNAFPAPGTGEDELDEETIEALKGLGYLQ